MINVTAAIVLFAIFVALLIAVRARGGKARINSLWAAQSISLGLVCILMAAGGFLFKSMFE